MRKRFFGKIEEPFDGICVRSLFSVWSLCLISKWQLPANLHAIQQNPLGILRINRIISPYLSSNLIWGNWGVRNIDLLSLFYVYAIKYLYSPLKLCLKVMENLFALNICQKMQPVVKYVIRSLNVLWRVLSLNSIFSFHIYLLVQNIPNRKCFSL